MRQAALSSQILKTAWDPGSSSLSMETTNIHYLMSSAIFRIIPNLPGQLIE